MPQADHLDKETNLLTTADLVWPAIVLSEDRMAAINRRLEYILTACLAVAPAVLFAGKGKPFLCAWPIVGTSILGIAIAIAIVARSVGAARAFTLTEMAQDSQQSKDQFALKIIGSGQDCVDPQQEGSTIASHGQRSEPLSY